MTNITSQNTENTSGNLKPWPKGVSGNPAGRPPKEFSMTNAFKEVLAEKNPTTKIEKYKELIQKALSMAMRGDKDMIKYIINHLEGMPQGSNTQVAVQVNNFDRPPEEYEQMAVEFLRSKGYRVEKN